jgi:predicted TIM-barrel fold metal-dependent hydrolase
LPADRSREGIAGWKRALTKLAACPNAALKISGLGVPGQAWTVASNREVVLAAIDIFGIERSMFASNFPVDGLCASFDTIVTGMRAILDGFTAGEQNAFFHDNAIRTYDMERR